MAWATAEFVAGRTGRPLQLSSAKQVVGSVSRMLKNAGHHGGFVKAAMKDTITVEAVKAYVDYLTSRGRTPGYIADQV